MEPFLFWARVFGVAKWVPVPFVRTVAMPVLGVPVSPSGCVCAMQDSVHSSYY